MKNNIRSLRVFERHFYDNNYPAQIDALTTQIATKENDAIRQGQLIFNIINNRSLERDWPEEEYLTWISVNYNPQAGLSGFEMYLNEIARMIGVNEPGPPNTPQARTFYHGPNYQRLKASLKLKRQLNEEARQLRRQLATIQALSKEKRDLEKLAKVSQTRLKKQSNCRQKSRSRYCRKRSHGTSRYRKRKGSPQRRAPQRRASQRRAPSRRQHRAHRERR